MQLWSYPTCRIFIEAFTLDCVLLPPLPAGCVSKTVAVPVLRRAITSPAFKETRAWPLFGSVATTVSYVDPAVFRERESWFSLRYAAGFRGCGQTR